MLKNRKVFIYAQQLTLVILIKLDIYASISNLLESLKQKWLFMNIFRLMGVKLKIFSAFSVVVFLFALTMLLVTINLNTISHDVDSMQDIDLKGISFLLEADRDAYQSNLAISHAISNKSKSDKLLNDGVVDNLRQVHTRFNKFKALFEDSLTQESSKFNEFEKTHQVVKNHTNNIVTLIKASKFDEAKRVYFEAYIDDFKKMRGAMDYFTEKAYHASEFNHDEADSLINSSITIFTATLIIIIITVILISIMISSNILKSLNALENGFCEFFDFLNKKTNKFRFYLKS